MKYISICCNVTAKKPACIATKDKQSGLGHWVCSQCGKNCKVRIDKKS